MSVLTRIDFHATIVTLVAVWQISGKDITGQWFMLVAQFLWLAHGIRGKQPWLSIQSMILGAMTVRALMVWGATP